MEYDYSTLTADPDGYLSRALAQLGAALSVRTECASESAWIDQASQLVASFPDPMIRARLAATCTLRQLKVLVRDEHLAVRLSCVDNPFAVDRDVQITLCRDHDIEVVRAFLNRFEPCLDAANELINHPQPSIRTRLISPRRRRELLDRLAADKDWAVRQLADDAREYQRAATSAQSGRMHHDR